MPFFRLNPPPIFWLSYAPATVTDKPRKTMRNKILVYKEATNSIYIGKEVSFSINTDQFHCTISTYCDPHYRCLITGDLTIIKINKLKKKMLTKGTNCNETHFINFSKVFLKLKRKSNLVIKIWEQKTKLPLNCFKIRRNKC